MKIQQADVRLTASHTQREEKSRQESLLFWVGDRPPEVSNNVTQPSDNVSISPRAAEILANNAPKPEISHTIEQEYIPVDPKVRAIQRILEVLTGKKINIASMESLKGTSPEQAAPIQEGQDNSDRQGWGLEYDATVYTTEIEETAVQAVGIVQTMDGESISFSLNLEMFHSHTEKSSIQIRAGDAKLIDPLVINFDGKATELSDMAFSFDLDGDGSEEQVPFVGQGSGFLVLDKNQDGIVNNGLELFGPATGNGFDELAVFDQDGNGWIDETDPIFEKLRVWSRDAIGNLHLQNLSQRGIGAILLERVESPFSIKNEVGTLQGVVKETSVFLGEDGIVGAIQEIDLAV